MKCCEITFDSKGIKQKNNILILEIYFSGLPLYIRDKYSNKIAIHQHITEYKSGNSF